MPLTASRPVDVSRNATAAGAADFVIVKTEIPMKMKSKTKMILAAMSCIALTASNLTAAHAQILVQEGGFDTDGDGDPDLSFHKRTGDQNDGNADSNSSGSDPDKDVLVQAYTWQIEMLSEQICETQYEFCYDLCYRDLYSHRSCNKADWNQANSNYDSCLDDCDRDYENCI